MIEKMKKIAIISPASPGASLDKDALTQFFGNLGYKPVYGKYAFKENRFMSGTDEQRAHDVNWAFSDPEIDAVMTVRGGYGSARILDKIEYEMIKKNPKPFFGFSDITALQLALLQKSNLVTFTGIQASFIGKPIPNALYETFTACLHKEPITFENLTPVVNSKSTGKLIGGSLTLLTSLVGTPYMPDMKGAILVIEEVQEQPYRIDRMFEQLHLNGALNQLAGVVIGGFYKCLSKDTADGTIDEVLQERFGTLKIPVVKDFHYAHGVGEIVFPIGALAILDATNGTLEINTY